MNLRSQRWIIYVNIGVLRTNIHNILSEGCLVLLQEVLRPQGSNKTVSPLHKFTSPCFKCSVRGGGGQRSRTVLACQLALHEVQGSEERFGMPRLGCRNAAGEWTGTYVRSIARDETKDFCIAGKLLFSLLDFLLTWRRLTNSKPGRAYARTSVIMVPTSGEPTICQNFTNV